MNNYELKMGLMNEISSELQDLNNLEAGGEEQKQVVENVTKLTNLVINMDAKAEDREVREEEQQERKKERWIKLGLGAATVGVTAWQLIDRHIKWRQLLKFEETGTISSSGGRQLVSNLFKMIK